MELSRVLLGRISFFFGKDIQEEHGDDVTLFFLLEGQGRLESDNKTYVMNPDDIVLVNAGHPYSFHNNSDGFCARFLIPCEDLAANSNKASLFFLCNSVEYPDEAKFSQLRALLKYMIKDYTTRGLEDPTFLQCSDYFKLLHILTSFFTASERLSSPLEYEGERKENIVSYINAKYSEDISLSSLASYLGLTESYLSRKFKTYFQMTFVDYLYDVRIEKAKYFLEYTKKNLTDISFDCGFPNAATFNKRFKAKYGMNPSSYREQKKNELSKKATAQEKKESGAVKKALTRYFNSAMLPDEIQPTQMAEIHEADFNVCRPYVSIWNWCINVGSAESVLNSDMQDALRLAQKDIHFQYGRIWSLFSPNMYIVGPEVDEMARSKYNRLFRVIDFLLSIGMKPILEIGEKRTEIRKTPRESLKKSDNITSFKSYEHFLSTFEDMVLRLSEAYGEQEISSWIFELWDDERAEPYYGKRPYTQVFSDVRRILKSVMPQVKFGGAGNYLGWSQSHTEESLRRWMEAGVYPDYLTFTYSPYHVLDNDRSFSKIKSDEDDLLQTLNGLNDTLTKFCFPKMSGIYISEWNMTESSRNYFNDSLWKASYVVKSYLDALGKVNGLFYSQLSDITTDYYDNQKLLTGSGGLITRDQIEKPSFLAMRLLKHLLPFIVDKGDGYIVTRDEYGKIAILCFNFVERNYNYYLKEEDENSLEAHYSYFTNPKKKTFHFVVKNLPSSGEYLAHHHVINRSCGSIMDEWAKFDFLESLQSSDLDYLRNAASPKLSYTTGSVVDGVLDLEVTLEPWEVRCISLRKKR